MRDEALVPHIEVGFRHAQRDVVGGTDHARVLARVLVPLVVARRRDAAQRQRLALDQPQHVELLVVPQRAPLRVRQHELARGRRERERDAVLDLGRWRELPRVDAAHEACHRVAVLRRPEKVQAVDNTTPLSRFRVLGLPVRPRRERDVSPIGPDPLVLVRVLEQVGVVGDSDPHGRARVFRATARIQPVRQRVLLV
eukprot:530616-Rhodomonas_salina.1